MRRWKFLVPFGNLVFSPDGRLLAAAPFARFNMGFWSSGDVLVFLLETETGKMRPPFKGKFSAAVAFGILHHAADPSHDFPPAVN